MLARVVLVAIAFSLGLHATPASAQDRTISGDHFVGCVEKEYFNKLSGYAAQKDIEAFKKALAVGVLSGVCTLFERGDRVYISDTAIFSGMVQVRRAGDTTEYWTNLEAISSK